MVIRMPSKSVSSPAPAGTALLVVVLLGGVGVVSVASNLLPRQVSDLCHACVEGRFDEARKLNRQLTPIFKAMFIESNPIPVKAALAMTGMIEEVYRLPLTPMSQANRAKLELLANTLMEKEVLDVHEVRQLLSLPQTEETGGSPARAAG